GSLLYGWTLAHGGQAGEGLEQMYQGLRALRATGAELHGPYFLVLLAELYGIIGQPEAGLTMLAEAMALVYKTGERCCEPEIYRLQGALLLQQSPDHHTEAHTCFQQAIDVARHQEAKSWELRAAISL